MQREPVITAILAILLLLLAGCSTPPPVVPNYPGCTGCGAEFGNSGAGTVYPGRGIGNLTRYNAP